MKRLLSDSSFMHSLENEGRNQGRMIYDQSCPVFFAHLFLLVFEEARGFISRVDYINIFHDTKYACRLRKVLRRQMTSKFELSMQLCV